LLCHERVAALVKWTKNRSADGAQVRDPSSMLIRLDVAGSCDDCLAKHTEINVFGVHGPDGSIASDDQIL